MIATTPIFGVARNEANQVFQMTIKRRRKHRGVPKEEYFEVFPGAVGNDVRIIDVDKERRQVIMTVHEPRRTFTFKEFDRKKLHEVTRTRTTPDWKRSYLVGMDQTHLFIAELPKGASTVKMAHDILKPSVAKGRKDVRRQGEWFFIPVTPEQEMIITEHLVEVKEKARISGNTRNFHVAEKLLVIKEGEREFIFASGKITHPEHHALVLKKWCSVTRNMERSSTAGRVGWID